MQRIVHLGSAGDEQDVASPPRSEGADTGRPDYRNTQSGQEWWVGGFVGGGGCLAAHYHSATLADAANAAGTAVATLYSKYPPVPDAELQMAIFPSKYDGDLILDINEDAGTFTAQNLEGGEPTVSAPSLDQLIQAARLISNVSDGQYMFRWIRPVASLARPEPPA
jgi:hypothetical protein